MGSATHFAVIENGEMGEVENDDYVAALVRFAAGSHAAGAVGTLEASRVSVGPQCGLGFEIYGTDGSAAWNFERMNEFRLCLCRGGANAGYTTVLGNADLGDYGRFQPGPGNSMSYDDLKVIEAKKFLVAAGGGDQRNSTIEEALADAGVDQALLDKAPALRVVARTGVGVELVDVAAATARGIAVVITPGAGAAAVAEGVIGMALHLVKRFGTLTALVREGRWAQRTEVPVGDLGGAALGVVGYGRIGQRTAELGAAFGMRILAYDPVSEPPADVRCTDLGDLAGRSDVITLHLPLTGQTRHLVDDAFLARVKPGAVLVNCSRGGLIDTDAVWRALAAGRLSGVGLDVFDPEPPGPHPLYRHPDVVLTPHLMGLSRRATVATFTAAARGVLEVLAGREPQAVANPAWRTHRHPEEITHDQLR